MENTANKAAINSVRESATREVDARGTHWPAEFFAEGIDYTFHAFAGNLAHARRSPARNEVFVWLLRNDWQLVSSMTGRNGLSMSERKRMKNSRNTAAGRQFGVQRASLRMVTSRALCCEPGEVQLEETPRGVCFASTPDSAGKRSITADVVSAGAWLLIAVSVGELAVGVAGPLIDNTNAGDTTRASFSLLDAQQQARELSLTRACAENPGWRTLDIPLPGDLRGAVACDHLTTAVTAFGWRR
ncbi:hypothetical protein ASG35_09460 [Burkholderia sp. Leaf177]|uniref:hypothetical protein n=1 Tax=Burkholderia sp. Leaf177 TaxID=1736287 RepID=UPI0006F5ECA3|nr:hypothetical protein [Burkholderia sp. Leaf177]KQR78621.1 hypothetical protein ASG35_09460 [Burkholderia sp. Leaf177]